MNRLPHIAMLLVAVALVAADKGEKEKSDAEKIQGKWICVEMYSGGMNVSQLAREKGLWCAFSGKKFSRGSKLRGEQFSEGSFDLRPGETPRELDTSGKQDGKVETAAMVYELSGNTLKICFFPGGGGERPKMVDGDGGGRMMMVFKRVKPEKKIDKK